MGTLRFFEEVVSFKIRRTFGFADYIYNALMRHEDAIDAVIICGSETCGAAGTICYGAPPGKIFTLCGDPGGEELEAELFRLLDAIFTQANRINL